MPNALIERPEPGIACLLVNRPEKRNAIDPATRGELLDALAALVEDNAVRAIVLAGKGGVFCAGGDIDSMTESSVAASLARMRHGHRFVRQLILAEKPVIAAVEGFAFGAGAGYALLADTVIMGEGAAFGIPFLNLGLLPDWGLFYTLPRRIGVGRAKQMILYAQRMKGAEALAAGLADKVVPDAEVMAAAMAQARIAAAQPPQAFALAKRALTLFPQDLDTALELEAIAQAASFQGGESKEGLAAWREKRKPNF